MVKVREGAKEEEEATEWRVSVPGPWKWRTIVKEIQVHGCYKLSYHRNTLKSYLIIEFFLKSENS